MPDDPLKPQEPEDDGLYELAEDPEDTPSEPPPIAPGLVNEPEPAAEAGEDAEPSYDLPPDPATMDAIRQREAKEQKKKKKTEVPADTGSRGEGGKGADSHFSGEDPEYVNPEIARMRREDQRKAAAMAEAEAEAKKKKVMLIGAGGGVLLLILVWFIFLR